MLDKTKENVFEIRPALEEVREIANGYQAATIFLELSYDACEPLLLFCALKYMSKHCFLLDSAKSDSTGGRYTFIGFDPKAAISYSQGILEVDNGVVVKVRAEDPTSWIKQILDDYRCPSTLDLPPFTGGLVGYFAYDYIAVVEPSLTLTQNDAEGFKDMDLMLFDRIIAYDHLLKRLLLIATIKTEYLQENYALASQELHALAQTIYSTTDFAPKPEPLKIEAQLSELFDKQHYMQMVEKAKRYIAEGDIFQVVLSNQLCAPATGSLFETYCLLRKNNPSPYQFYFSSDVIEVAGASPETLVRVIGDDVETFPLAGTRPRGANEEADNALGVSLLDEEKELAEHNMLVDLGRNDIGKVSEFGTVLVKRYQDILRFSHVMHIGSVVCGKLKKGKSAMDVLAAVLPAGTLSGAPKIRACQIINELEDNRRGIYGGAIGYLGFNGNLDTCIAIRLVFKKQGKLYVRSGAGIVANSDAQSEYQECCNKMAAVKEALKVAGWEKSAGDTRDDTHLAKSIAIEDAKAAGREKNLATKHDVGKGE